AKQVLATIAVRGGLQIAAPRGNQNRSLGEDHFSNGQKAYFVPMRARLSRAHSLRTLGAAEHLADQQKPALQLTLGLEMPPAGTLTPDIDMAVRNSSGSAAKLSDDPNTRMEQLMYASEDLRQIDGKWQRYWFTNAGISRKPVHAVYPV